MSWRVKASSFEPNLNNSPPLIVAVSGLMTGVLVEAQRLSSDDCPVLIQGETGTGKELVARALHEKSPRSSGPFVAVNCAAIPAELIESELFGHEKGSFTGAAARHLGKFEQAEHGTLFLDEIGDMPLPMQAKLLRVLEEAEVERLGAAKPIRVDVRMVVATHRNLEELVRQGKFRQDLFHRVFVFPLFLPPLRDRRDDIRVLVNHFQAQICSQNNWKAVPFAADAMEILEHYCWPGNVRELRNMVERLMLLAQETVDAATVRSAIPASSDAIVPGLGSGSLAERVQRFEREVILAELKRAGFHMTNAARTLGLERSHLYKKAEQLGLNIQKEKREEES